MPSKPDIIELYGLPPTDPRVADRLVTRTCPFTQNRCTKIERGSSTPTGVCAVTAGSTRNPVVICDNRLHGDWFATLRVVASECFGAPRFIVGGSKLDLANRLSETISPAVVAHSGVDVMGKSKVHFDWLLQHYDYHQKMGGFAAVQTLTMDISGSYRACLEGYREIHAGKKSTIPPSTHSVNWPNLQKKIMPDIIKRGLILAETSKCWGNYLLVSETTYGRLSAFFEGVPERAQIAGEILSIRVYTPDRTTTSGVRVVRTANLSIKDIATAFYARADEKACERLEMLLKNLL
jgi:hypothetical protein